MQDADAVDNAVDNGLKISDLPIRLTAMNFITGPL